MKKCKFCNHSGYTEKREQVCTKYLLYVGEDKFEKPCEGFEFNLNNHHLILAGVAIILVVTIVICGL